MNEASLAMGDPVHTSDPVAAPAPPRTGPVLVSVIIPLFDEAPNVEPLVQRLRSLIDGSERRFEVVFADDGSSDGTADLLRPHVLLDPRLILVRLARHAGKGAALDAGIRAAGGEILVTLDGDLQDDPGEVPRLLDALDRGLDLVCGHRRVRRDPVTKTIPSRAYNLGIRWATGLPLHDVNCGLRAFTRQVTDAIEIYGENYRLLPLRAHARGFRVGEVEVGHHPRANGRSKFGALRFSRGFLDVLTAIFLIRFAERPAHFFGGAGFLFTLAGLAVCGFITYLRLATGTIQSRYPLLILGALLLVTGFQLLTTGFLAELQVASRHVSPRSRPVASVERGGPSGDSPP